MKGPNTHKQPETHPSHITIHTCHCYALRNLLHLSKDDSGQCQILTDTKRHQQMSPDTQKGCLKIVWQFRLTSKGVLWCLLFLRGYLSVVMDVCRVLVHLRVLMSKIPKPLYISSPKIIAHFEIFGPVRNKLLVTVTLDHPEAIFQLSNKKMQKHPKCITNDHKDAFTQ